jgi:integrase
MSGNRRDHGDGGIDERAPGHFRLRWRVNGRRFTKSFHGSIADARKELRRLIKSADDGQHVAPDKITVEQYLTDWLASDTGLSPKTCERYRGLLRLQIAPHLGATAMQALRPDQVEAWHRALLDGGLAARTVGHAHRVLHTGFERAVKYGVVSRNVVHVVKPPRVEAAEIKALSPEQIPEIRAKLAGHPILPVFELAIGSGMRRGEICGLLWGAVDLPRGAVRVECALEQTAAGVRVKAPKTKYGRRTIALPRIATEALREHWRDQCALRLQIIGLGRPDATDYVFPSPASETFAFRSPDALSGAWRDAVYWRKLPKITFHALRHSHASALIAAGVDVLTVSRRLGHANPSITLNVYAHLFNRTDAWAAQAIERALGGASR